MESGQIDKTRETFASLKFQQMAKFEECFNTNINVFCLESSNKASMVYKSLLQFKNTINLNIFDFHFSLITNLDAFSKSYYCSKCDYVSNRHYNLLRHERTCDSKTRFKYVDGHYEQSKDIFELAEGFGIFVPQEERNFPWVATYDFEAYLKKENVQKTENLKLISEHVPISVAICSNVEDYKEPICFIDPNENTLISKMIEYLEKVQEKTEKLAKAKWSYVFDKINATIKSWEEDVPAERDTQQLMLDQFNKFKSKFTSFCKVLPVCVFNYKYDINLCKSTLIRQLNMTEEKTFTIRKNNAYNCISTEKFKFLDITSYLPPGTSYSKFLKAFQVDEQKSFWCYEYLDDPKKLSETRLPPIEKWYSSLKQKKRSR